MIKNINDFFRYRKAFFGNFETFKDTGIYKHFTNIFGELVYTSDTKYFFIGIDSDGYYYDEIYYPMDIKNKVGTIVPKIFLSSHQKTPDIIWKDVAEKGYAIIQDFDFNKEDKKLVINDTYMPFGFNKDFDLHQTMLHPFYATEMDYDNPEKHKNPDYLNRITGSVVNYLKTENYKLHTTDSVKYIYKPDLPESFAGPYSFHFDYFPRLMYMFFTYFSKDTPIVGRELMIGKRHDLLDFSSKILDSNNIKDPEDYNPFEKIKDKSLVEYDTIEIKDNMVVLMNTLNPLFLHRVERLKKENEVILLTNYVWSKEI
jgi:hypothetical protein